MQMFASLFLGRLGPNVQGVCAGRMNMFICINAKYSQKPPPNSHIRVTLAFTGFLIPGASHHLGQSLLVTVPPMGKDASSPDPDRPLSSPSFVLRHRPPREGLSDLSHLKTLSLLHSTLTHPSYSPVEAISTGMNNCRDKNKPLQVSCLKALI